MYMYMYIGVPKRTHVQHTCMCITIIGQVYIMVHMCTVCNIIVVACRVCSPVENLYMYMYLYLCTVHVDCNFIVT